MGRRAWMFGRSDVEPVIRQVKGGNRAATLGGKS